jgi:CubicO group peptidase (beta-lactamase class C family)
MPKPRKPQLAGHLVRALRWPLATCAAVLLAAPAATQPQVLPPPPRDEKNASFWHRIDFPPPVPIFPPDDWYSPLTPLEGRPGPFIEVAKPAKVAFSARTIEQATNYADLAAGDALLVARDGVLQLEHYADGKPGSDAHRFSTHSMTRGLGALAIGILVDRKVIKSIDDSASVYIREWRDDPRKAITIRQLLEMSSGIKADFNTDPGSAYMQAYYGADVEQIVAHAPLVNAPGTTYFFDSHNNHAIGLIVERASGLPYQEFVSRNIWQKLGAADAQMMLDRPGGRVMAFCCTLVTPRDWLRVGELLRDGGSWRGQRIVSAAWVREMRKPSAANAHYGLQLFLGSAWMDGGINGRYAKQKDTLEPIHSEQAFYLTGAGDINLMVVPEQKLTILRTGHPSADFRFHVLPNLLIDDLTKKPVAGAWSSLYPWRFTLPPAKAPTLDGSGLRYWPTARLDGAASPVPLPRAPAACAAPAPAPAPATSASASAAAGRATTPTAFDAIDEKLAAKGMSYGLIVWQDGAVRHEHFAGSFDATTRGESASMHKSVMALLFGKAIEERKISTVDAPISTWIPEWAADPRGAITVRNLLQMSSGLAPIAFQPAIGGKSSLLFSGSDLESLVLSLDYKEKPGTVFEYFGHVSELLALVLQRATGVPYADYLQSRLWAPLGASPAYVALDRPGGIVKAYASLLATPEDWVRIGRLFLDDGVIDGRRVIPAGWVAQMTQPAATNPNYGFQIWLGGPHQPHRAYSTTAPTFTVPAAEPFLAPDTAYFDGATARRVYVSKAEKLVIVRLGDADPAWDDSWLPNAVVTALRECR